MGSVDDKHAGAEAMGEGLEKIPGTLTSTILITTLTVLLAICADYPQVDAVLRPLYFAVLFGFFHSIGRRQRSIRVMPFRLIVGGFGVLTLGSATSTVISLSGLEPSHFLDLLTVSLDRGAVFLLGLSLISYGIVLWVPHLLQSERILNHNYTVTKGELRKSEKARSTMEEHFVDADRLRALGELAAGIAHDLRNPLTIVKATAESLARRPRNQEEIVEHIKVIDRNLDKAERTIAALLDLGKPRSFEPREVDLDQAVAEVLSLTSVESRRLGIGLVQQGTRGITVLADPKMLTQAVLNLILNALQASAQGGEIQVVTRTSTIGEGYGVLAVADRGVGIDPENRSRLFTPFFTTKADGTGLGLLSTRRVAHEMGGRVGLYPRGAGGARAVLLLPLSRSPSPRAEEVASL